MQRTNQFQMTPIPSPKVLFSEIAELIADPGPKPPADKTKQEFSTADIDDVDSWLWTVGSLDNISTLHHQKVLLRDIIPSESPRLHLVWFDRTIYIKPLPDYLLNFKYCQDVVCNEDELYTVVVGFLRSYCKLIKYPVDLEIAKAALLVSPSVKWDKWNNFRDEVLKNTGTCVLSKRYRYGELRLSRLNLIWRFTLRGIVYFTVHRTYSTYFNQYFRLLVTTFALIATILTAMQVLIGITDISASLSAVCYWFSVVTLLAICICFIYIGSVYVVMFVWNFAITLWKHWKKRKQRKLGKPTPV